MGGGVSEPFLGSPGPSQYHLSHPWMNAKLIRNLELLVKVYLCFGLEGQLADLLERKAPAVVHLLGRPPAKEWLCISTWNSWER